MCWLVISSAVNNCGLRALPVGRYVVLMTEGHTFSFFDPYEQCNEDWSSTTGSKTVEI